MKRLRDIGNTLIVVEHDEETIRNADFVVDVGGFLSLFYLNFVDRLFDFLDFGVGAPFELDRIGRIPEIDRDSFNFFGFLRFGDGFFGDFRNALLFSRFFGGGVGRFGLVGAFRGRLPGGGFFRRFLNVGFDGIG